MSSAVGLAGISSCPARTPSSSCCWNWPTTVPSCGEQFWKLDLQISRNRSQSASLPKPHQHLQMVFTDCCFPICLLWPSPLKGASSLCGWRWMIGKNFPSSFYAATGPFGFHPCRSSWLLFFYLPALLCLLREKNYQWQRTFCVLSPALSIRIWKCL